MPSYAYSYGLGQPIVLSLSRQYQVEGNVFVPDYLQLAACESPVALLQILTEAALHLASPALRHAGFDASDGTLAKSRQLP